MRLRVRNIGGKYRKYFGEKVWKWFHQQRKQEDLMILPKLNLLELATRIWIDFNRSTVFTNEEIKLRNIENLEILSYLGRHFIKNKAVWI
jgi:hypothetical protein